MVVDPEFSKYVLEYGASKLINHSPIFTQKKIYPFKKIAINIICD